MLSYKIDFLKYRYMCFAVSALLLVFGLILYFAKGGFKYSIDFVGGAEIRASFQEPIKANDLRSALSKKGWQDYNLQSVGNTDKEYFIRVSGQIKNLEEKFSQDIKSEISSNKMTIENIDFVGAEVGKEMQSNALIAIVLSLIVLLGYITIRSKYAYAVGAVVALVHDLLAVLVFLLLFNELISINILAAILSILGYSLNDTIVIFNRIRENLKKHKDMSSNELVNLSINQTLTRTLLVSFSTLLGVLSFYVFGGEVLRGFSFAMLVGIVVGTYSSIYIASPIMIIFGGLSSKR
ncbi:protein translocase subunit SecF [Candidatus Babeliales bacterium]|nr:protein translocase subunit SecF [Candidatus Babeliales bacterium]MCF7899214.1 protein translocase subunit SecF [Candidatus Babeliales bacterium]